MDRPQTLSTAVRIGRMAPVSLAFGALAWGWAPAQGADFFLYLQCEGKVRSGGRDMPAHVHLALRDNNTSALIQKSNVLPVGQRLRYDVSPQMYSMSYHVPATGSALLYDWWRGVLFVWQPNLKQITTVRLSIDRQEGGLTGEMVNAEAQQLGTLSMQCAAVNEAELPEPKF